MPRTVRATRSMQRTTANAQHASGNMQRAACSASPNESCDVARWQPGRFAAAIGLFAHLLLKRHEAAVMPFRARDHLRRPPRRSGAIAPRCNMLVAVAAACRAAAARRRRDCRAAPNCAMRCGVRRPPLHRQWLSDGVNSYCPRAAPPLSAAAADPLNLRIAASPPPPPHLRRARTHWEGTARDSPSPNRRGTCATSALRMRARASNRRRDPHARTLALGWPRRSHLAAGLDGPDRTFGKL
jgi:hypothetical protein